MDRRDFLKGVAATSSAGALASLTAGLGTARRAGAAESSDASGQALGELLSLIQEVEQRYLGPEWNITTRADRAEGRRFLMHALQHALEVWMEADPLRPVFHRFVTPYKKLLGDNPDALYYTTAIDPARSYRIRGNLAGATYTSFTVEAGTAEGKGSSGLVSALNDLEFDVRSDGSYEIIASPQSQPQTRGWLQLAPQAGSITTRHYFEWERSAAADPTLEIPLVIEPLDRIGPAGAAGDAEIAAGIRRVANFVRALTLDWPPRAPEQLPSWSSRVPNQFPQPRKDRSNEGVGFAAKDNVYAMCPYVLEPGQALVMRGRFPRCRFANVVTWNRYMQTRDFVRRQTSLNRRQTKLETDGGFQMVLAHEDPRVPNWLDTAGRPSGSIFWRFQLPEEDIAPIETEVMPVERVARALGA
jgi:hypothetical protein